MEWLGYPAVTSYKGLDMSSLPLNHAWVITNTTIDNVGVYSVRDDCFNCPFKLEKHLKANEFASWQAEVSHQATWRILKHDNPVETMARNRRVGWLCEMRPTLHEYGVHRLDIGRCEVRPEVPPVHSYYPLLLCTLILLGASLIYTSINYMWERKRKQKQDKVVKALKIEVETQEEETPTLHVFRGLLLCLIIFMTTGGGGYPIFNNTWGGLTVAECLCFAYVWSVGVNIPTVMDKAVKEKNKCAIVRDIFVKALTLVFLGTLIDSTVEDKMNTVQLWCPLQRMGIAYFIVASAYVLTVQKFQMKSKIIICKAISNVISLLWCWIISAFVLSLIIISISTFISFNCLSNIAMEDLRPDNLNVGTEMSENCNNKFTEYINKLFVGESEKMINGNQYVGFCRGAIGIMSTMMYMLIGLKTGIIYLQHQSHSDKFKLWTLWATLFGIGGICLAGVSYPLDFNLWPISSILLLSTIFLYIFSIFYYVTEVSKLKAKILSSFGETSLVILSGHLLFSLSVPFNMQIYLHNHLFILLQNLWILSLWLIVSIVLMRRNIKFEI